MVKKEVNEIRKQVKKDGALVSLELCYVGPERDVLLRQSKSFLTMEETEAEHYYQLLKKVLSGRIDSTLLNLGFPAEEEKEGGKQRLIAEAARNASDSDAANVLFGRIMENYEAVGNYLIIFAYGTYDVPLKSTDEEMSDEFSESVYTFMLCGICPVEMLQPGLCYNEPEKAFTDGKTDWVVKPPQTGFLFPSFTGRTPDIHECLYYTKKSSEPHPEFTENVLGCVLPDEASMQKEHFREVVTETLGKEADVDTLVEINKNVQEYVTECDTNGEPAEMDTREIQRILNISGVQKEISSDISVMASNIAEQKYIFETDGIKVTVSPSAIDMVGQKIVDGRPCLLLPLSDMTLNGIGIRH